MTQTRHGAQLEDNSSALAFARNLITTAAEKRPNIILRNLQNLEGGFLSA